MPAGPSHHSQGATVAAVPRFVDAGSMCSVATLTRPQKILARGGRQSTLRRPPDEAGIPGHTPVPPPAHLRNSGGRHKGESRHTTITMACAQDDPWRTLTVRRSRPSRRAHARREPSAVCVSLIHWGGHYGDPIRDWRGPLS